MTQAMTEELYGFLVDLAQDPARQLAFAASPGTELAGRRLSPANQALLLRRDGRALHAAFAEEGVTTAATFGDPGPDPTPDPDVPPPPSDPSPSNAVH